MTTWSGLAMSQEGGRAHVDASPLEEGRVDGAGAHDGRRDAGAFQFGGKALGEGDDPGLVRGIGTRARARGDGADVEDRAASARTHGDAGVVGERHDGANHDVQAVDFAFQTVVQEGASQPESGIVDEEVDGSQVRLLSTGRASHVEAGCDPRAPVLGGQVGSDVLGVHARDVCQRSRERAQRVLTACDEHQVVSGGGQLPAEFFTNSGGRSGHKRGSHVGSLARTYGVARGRGPSHSCVVRDPGQVFYRVRIRKMAPPPARAAGMMRRSSQ